MTKKEKEAKPRFNEYIDTYKKESSVEGKNKREEMERRTHDGIEQSLTKYLIKKRGKHETEEGTPKTYSLESHDEAHEFVLEMARSILKHKYPKMNKDGLDGLLKDESYLMELLDSIAGERGAAYRLVSHLREHPDDVMNNKMYQEFRDALTSHVANYKHAHAQQYLVNNEEKRGDIETLVNKELGSEGHEKELRKGLKQHNLVQHLGAAYGGNLTKPYVEKAYKSHFKKKPMQKAA